MEKYEVFALISLAVSLISMAFCGFGLYFMVGNVEWLSGQINSMRKIFLRKKPCAKK